MRQWELLQLTDIHFGDLHPDDDKIATPPEFRDNLRPRIVECLAAYQDSGIPDALLLTGDMTVRGDEAAMRACASALRPFAHHLRDEGRIVAAVPGNHDVAWGLPSSRPQLFDDKFRMFREFVRHLHADTCLIPVGRPAFGELDFALDTDPVAVDPVRKLLVVSINSAVRCGELNEELKREAEELIRAADRETSQPLFDWIARRCVFDIAHVTMHQRQRIADALASRRKELGAEWDGYLRVAILHHHLVGFAGSATEHKPFEMTVDAPQILRLLAEYEVHLVLTGHKHNPYFERHTVGLGNGREHQLILAGGATVLGDLPRSGGSRGFNLISVHREGSGELTFQFNVLPIESRFEFAGRLAEQKTKNAEGPPSDPHLPNVLTLDGPPALSRSVLPGRPRPKVRLPGNGWWHLPEHVYVHEPVRLLSGLDLREYCFYCKRLAQRSKRLFTLLMIEPRVLIDDVCRRKVPPENEREFLELVDDRALHYEDYRRHQNAVRIVVWDGDDWLARNRKSLRHLKWLNGAMRCLVVRRERLRELEPRIFLVDHTAVDNQVCMYDPSSRIMAVGQIDAANESYTRYFRLADGQESDPTFVPFDQFLAAQNLGGERS